MWSQYVTTPSVFRFDSAFNARDRTQMLDTHCSHNHYCIHGIGAGLRAFARRSVFARASTQHLHCKAANRVCCIGARLTQVTLEYQAEKLHRPDIALLSYGWVSRSWPPLLLAHDYGGSAAENMRSTLDGFITTPRSDNEYSRAAPCLSAKAKHVASRRSMYIRQHTD